MGSSIGPKIVTDRLVMYLDAFNNRSYIGSGDEWLDVSPSKNDMKYLSNSGALVYDSTTKSFDRVTVNTTDFFRSDTKVDLTGGFTMNALMYAHTHGNTTTANGVITNHDYANNTGGGITLRCLSATDYRLSCNTGSGTSRTYNTYYGTTNIKNMWTYCTMRYDDSNNLISLWVNGIKELEIYYIMVCKSDYVDLYSWAVNYTNANYKPGVKLNNISIYNKDLTDEEILQNYNTLKNRF